MIKALYMSQDLIQSAIEKDNGNLSKNKVITKPLIKTCPMIKSAQNEKPTVMSVND